MRQQIEYRVIVGILIWIALISMGILFLRNSQARSPDTALQLAQFIGKQRHTVSLNLTFPQVLRVGDPVFLADSKKYAPIGFVSSVAAGDSKALYYTDRAQVTFYGNSPNFDDQAYLEYHMAPNTSEWVLKTMLPPEKREEIGRLILDGYSKHQSEIVAALRPLVEDSLRDASRILRDDLRAAFLNHEEEIKRIGQKYQTQLFEKEIIPLIQKEIWPIVQQESEPLAALVGQEIWQEVSVFRFGWRYLYDRSPLPEKRLAEREFERFLDEKVIPILKSYLPEFVILQQQIIQRVAENRAVTATFRSSMNKILNDPAVQVVFTDVFQEVFIDNKRLRESFEENWKSPRAKQALQQANRLLEPTITEIGVALFGSPREKITPEFAKVLRHRILHKDDRWFLLHLNGPSPEDESRYARPTTIDVEVADPVGEIPYAASNRK